MIDQRPDGHRPFPADVAPKRAGAQLEFVNVSVTNALGTRTLLRDISFRLFPGERLGVVGPSGAGKTTLLRLINRLEDPTSGTIYVEGDPLQQRSVIAWRQEAMLVPQEPKLLGMTVQAALDYPLQLQQVPEQEIAVRSQTWQQRLNIPEDWLARTEVQLSLGQRQVVSLARACLAAPKILLLDEPTAALDVGRNEQVLQVLRQLPSTVVLVSHQLDWLQRVCDRILWLEEGHLRADQTTQDLDWTHLRTILEQQAQSQEDWD